MSRERTTATKTVGHGMPHYQGPTRWPSVLGHRKRSVKMTDILKGAEKAKAICLDKIVAVYEAATDEDKKIVKYIVDRAKTGVRECEAIKLTPGVAAILFIDHNKQNREWRHLASEAYAEEIRQGLWEYTNQGIGMLTSGNAGDGQHRLAAIALSGQAVLMSVTFGMEFSSIIAIDTGLRRQASDFLAIEHATQPKRKQAVLKQTFATLKRIAVNEEAGRPYVLKSGNRDTYAAIKLHDRLLDEALEIGDESVRGRSKPTLKPNEAAALTFGLLLQGWPKASIVTDLDVLQSGEDRDGGNSPLFVASDQLLKETVKHDGATVTARLAMALKGFVLHEQGVKGVRVTDIRNAMKAKSGLDITFPGPAQKAAE